MNKPEASSLELILATPRDFNFRRTVTSHGWWELPPFSFQMPTWTLTRTIDIGRARPITVSLTETKGGVKVRIPRALGRRALEKVTRDVRHILRLDDDLSEFYRAVAAIPEFEWIARQGAGRLLRSPTVFEDLVKMICTTNCSWALTDKMVRGLVNNLGRESTNGARTFPTPEAMAEQRVSFYRKEVRAGYRAPYLKELAQRVASGELDVEQWLDPAIRADELKREMKQVKGVGDYAAENLLKLVGRYDGLALDSWTRAKFSRVRNRGRKTADRKIERFYSAFNSWRGLALWCDMTRDWLEETQALNSDA